MSASIFASFEIADWSLLLGTVTSNALFPVVIRSSRTAICSFGILVLRCTICFTHSSPLVSSKTTLPMKMLDVGGSGAEPLSLGRPFSCGFCGDSGLSGWCGGCGLGLSSVPLSYYYVFSF